MNYFIYIITTKKNGTLYVGITSNLQKRIWQHKAKLIDGFTKKYSIDKLVYYEEFNSPDDAIAREKQLKWWKREWKIKLIENRNPLWIDLYRRII